jgi:hypothetical protein
LSEYNFDRAAAARHIAAWARVRSAEDLQVAWVAASELLDDALLADLDPELLERFGRRVRRLAADVSTSEDLLAKTWGSMLPYRVAITIAGEVLAARRDLERLGQLLEAFDGLGLLGSEDSRQ